MKLSEIPGTESIARLNGPGLDLQTGPFVFRVRTDLADIAAGVETLYGEFPILEDEHLPDFEVYVTRARGLRRWLKPQVIIYVDGEKPSLPLPLEQAFAVFEGCLNWCIYTHAHQYLIIHAACVEREGRAVLMPAPPGAGKSTLCAALVHRGWRLLTDELTLIDPQSGTVIPMARPISLKNESIEVIQRFSREAGFGPLSPNTIKGTIAHVRPPSESVARVSEPARVAKCVFPGFRASGALESLSVPKARAFMRIAASSVNYAMLGAPAFNALSGIMDELTCHELAYSNLEEAVAWFKELK